MQQEPQKQEQEEHHKHRTFGNKMFDMVVYPTIAFGAVFAFSIWALHTTKYGSGRAREVFENINKKIAGKLEHIPLFKHMSPEKRGKEARNYASILVSFAAGTILISPIKWFEDQRDKISESVDRLFHKTPKDRSQYAKEPHQSWKSIYGSRVLTFGTVLALGTAIGEKRTAKVTETAVEAVAKQWKKWKPATTEAGLTKVRQWADVSAFETFYTALCATLVYTLSRSLARFFNKRDHHAHDHDKALPAPLSSTSGTQGEGEQEAENARSSWRDKTGNAPLESHAKNVIFNRKKPSGVVLST